MKKLITKLLPLFALLGALAARGENIVTLEGVLYAHVNAIGGETTGIVIQHDDGKTTDLEIKDPKMLALAESLDQRRVIASGLLKIANGAEIPNRRVLETISLAAANRDVVCKSKTSDYRLEISLEKKRARVLKGPALLTTLNCVIEMTFPGVSCYEPNMADAGYSVLFRDTSGVMPNAELYEMFIWGHKLVDKLTCF